MNVSVDISGSRDLVLIRIISKDSLKNSSIADILYSLADELKDTDENTNNRDSRADALGKDNSSPDDNGQTVGRELQETEQLDLFEGEYPDLPAQVD